jgi:hypothetical protein
MDGKFDPGGKLQIDGPREAPLFLPVVLPPYLYHMQDEHEQHGS